jgi:aromatic amino acid aminotransferase I
MVCELNLVHWGVADVCLIDLEISLNYGQATGAAQLLRFVTEHTEV